MFQQKFKTKKAKELIYKVPINWPTSIIFTFKTYGPNDAAVFEIFFYKKIFNLESIVNQPFLIKHVCCIVKTPNYFRS